MSLIKCPECGKIISDKADRCVNCGYPISGIQNICNRNEDKTGYYNAAQDGDPKAQFNYGLCLLNGVNINRNINDGFKWIAKAAKSGSPDALDWLGLVYQEGEYVDEDIEYAMRLYYSAAKKGNLHAKSEWAYYQLVDAEVEDDSEIYEFAKTSMSSYLKSCYVVAYCLYMGCCGVENDNKMAKNLFNDIFSTTSLESVFNADETTLITLRADSAFYLSVIYEYGTGVDEDLIKALYFIRESNKMANVLGQKEEQRIKDKISEENLCEEFLNRTKQKIDIAWSCSPEVRETTKNDVINDVVMDYIANTLFYQYFQNNKNIESLYLAYDLMAWLSKRSIGRQVWRILCFYYGLLYESGLIVKENKEIADQYFIKCIGKHDEKNGRLSYNFNGDTIVMFLGSIDNYVKSAVEKMGERGLKSEFKCSDTYYDETNDSDELRMLEKEEREERNEYRKNVDYMNEDGWYYGEDDKDVDINDLNDLKNDDY